MRYQIALIQLLLLMNATAIANTCEHVKDSEIGSGAFADKINCLITALENRPSPMLVESDYISISNISRDSRRDTKDPRIRYLDFPVTFKSQFSDKPGIIIGLSGIDFKGKSSNRIQVFVLKSNPKSAVFRVKTWNDTEVYSANFFWVAHGR